MNISPTHKKTCKRINDKIDKINKDFIEETRKFSKNVEKEVSCMKDSYIRKVKKLKENFDALKKEYLVTCSDIDPDYFEAIHYVPAPKLNQQEVDVFTKYFTEDEVKSVLYK
jgi:hypothetical protein